MARRRLGLDISVSELLYMREQGMSVKEIAEAIDCSIATVYRYIPVKRIKASEASKGSGETQTNKVNIGAVGQAMYKALNKKQQPSKGSIKDCADCMNKGVACSFCIRNPFLKDYFSKEAKKQ